MHTFLKIDMCLNVDQIFAFSSRLLHRGPGQVEKSCFIERTDTKSRAESASHVSS